MGAKEFAISIKKDIERRINFYRRYLLLKNTYPGQKNFPSFKDFIKRTLPVEDKEGLVFKKALSLTRDCGERLWINSTDRLTKEEREDFQIVVIPNRHGHGGNTDFTSDIEKEFSKNPLKIDSDQRNLNPIAEFTRGKGFHKDPHEFPRTIKNMKKVDSVYIVASPLSDADFAEIADCASQYINNGAKEVNLIAPFIADEREDKNTEGRIITIQSRMRGLSRLVNRIVNFEPHSSATHAFAACSGIALAPLSMEEELIGQIKDKIEKEPYNWVMVRPDKGRNIVATRIEKRFHIKGVHLDQVRNSVNFTKTASRLKTNEREKLSGKKVILYDDEGGTLSTIKNVVLGHLLPSEVQSINIFLGHARLQKGWKNNLEEILKAAKEKEILIKIYATDSRTPIGNLSKFMKKNEGIITMVPVAGKVRKVIEAMVNGVNFWRDKNGTDWESAVLLAINGKNYKE